MPIIRVVYSWRIQGTTVRFRNCVSSRYCVFLLLILYAYNLEHQRSRACNLVLQILCAYLSLYAYNVELQTILYFRFCLLLLLNLQTLNFELQILCASTSQFASSQFRAPDFVCFYFSICKLTILSFRNHVLTTLWLIFCMLLLLNLYT